MILKDLLPARPIDLIEVRTNADSGFATEDMLFGYCRWDGENLIPLDGDTYNLDWHIEKHTWNNDGSLTVWILSSWVTSIWGIDEFAIDEVGGVHDSGTGTAPDGKFCGECYEVSCKNCAVWLKRKGKD